MARIGYTGGLSRQPVKMDTAGANFFAGMAGVQAMQQAQEKHQQEMAQSDQKLALLQSAENRSERELQIKEQEAYRVDTQFKAGLTTAKSKVSTWNGRDKPQWGSRGLQSQWQSLNDMRADIERRKSRGQDASAQELAFAQLSQQYNTTYESERYRNDASALATGVGGLYEELGLQPDQEIQALLDGVMNADGDPGGEPGPQGPNAAQVGPDALQKLRSERQRLLRYRQERKQRELLALDLGSMQEVFNSLRAGQIPEGFEISEDAARALADMTVADDKALLMTGSNHALLELNKALGGAFSESLDPWNVNSNIQDIQKEVRRLKGLFGMVRDKDTMDTYNLQKDVELRMRDERKRFQERERMAESLTQHYQQQGIPQDEMSPYMLFAQVHRGQSLKDDGMQYDDSAEYMELAQIVESRLEAIGGPRHEAIKILDENWRKGSKEREYFASIAPRFNEDQRRKGRGNAAFWEAAARDIAGQGMQMSEKPSSPAIDQEFLELEFTHLDDRGVLDQFGSAGVQAADALANQALSALGTAANALGGVFGATPTMRDPWKQAGVQSRMYQRYNSGDAARDERLHTALKAAGISEEEFFDRQETGMGLDVLGTVLDGEGIKAKTSKQGQPMTIMEYVARNPKKGGRLLHALRYPDEVYDTDHVAEPDAEPTQGSRSTSDRGVFEEERRRAIGQRALGGERTPIRATAEDRDAARLAAEVNDAERARVGLPGEGRPPTQRQSIEQAVGMEEFMRPAEDAPVDPEDPEPAGTPDRPRGFKGQSRDQMLGLEEAMRPETSASEDLRQRVRAGAARGTGGYADIGPGERLAPTSQFANSTPETLGEFLQMTMVGDRRFDPDTIPMAELQSMARSRLAQLRRRRDALSTAGRRRGGRKPSRAELNDLNRMIRKVEDLLLPE